MNYLDLEWKEDFGEYSTVMNDRFHIRIWPFGKIHQCVVFVEYPYGSRKFDGVIGVHMGLKPGRSAKEAMRRAFKWIELYPRKVLNDPEAEISWSIKNYPDLFSSREDVLIHLFCLSGTGHDWLDGHLVNCDQEPPLDNLNYFKTLLEETERTINQAESLLNIKISKEEIKEPKKEISISMSLKLLFNRMGPPILRIPPDVTPTWKTVAKEAAELMVKYGETKEIKEKGEEILNR